MLVTSQQRIGREHPQLVSEGRDQGSVVVRDATEKIFLDATPQERARRDAEALRHDADVYVVDVLVKLEEDLLRSLSVVRNGLRKVQAEQAAAAEAMQAQQAQEEPAREGEAGG